MQDAVAALASAPQLKLDFYDRGQIANWLRAHPGVQLWAREKLGRHATGWRPHGKWSSTPGGADDTLIYEENRFCFIVKSPSLDDRKFYSKTPLIFGGITLALEFAREWYTAVYVETKKVSRGNRIDELVTRYTGVEGTTSIPLFTLKTLEMPQPLT